MVASTYGVAGDNMADKGIFTLTLEAIAASQMKRAEREFVRLEHPAVRDFAVEHEEEEPFGGW